jgi:hypothetical protein
VFSNQTIPVEIKAIHEQIQNNIAISNLKKKYTINVNINIIKKLDIKCFSKLVVFCFSMFFI